jgi:hypothetical protein
LCASRPASPDRIAPFFVPPRSRALARASTLPTRHLSRRFTPPRTPSSELGYPLDLSERAPPFVHRDTHSLSMSARVLRPLVGRCPPSPIVSPSRFPSEPETRGWLAAQSVQPSPLGPPPPTHTVLGSELGRYEPGQSPMSPSYNEPSPRTRLLFSYDMFIAFILYTFPPIPTIPRSGQRSPSRFNRRSGRPQRLRLKRHTSHPIPSHPIP